MHVTHVLALLAQYHFLAPVHTLVGSFKMASYNYYYDLTSGDFQAATPNSQIPHRGNLSVSVAAPGTWCQPCVQAGSSTIPISMPSTSMQTSQRADQSKVDAYLRVLNPANKKYFRLFTLCNVTSDG